MTMPVMKEGQSMKTPRVAGFLGVMALAGVISAGCGASLHTALGRSTAHRVAKPTSTLLKTDGISIRVPHGWHLGQQVTVSTSTTTGLNAGYLVPQVPKDSAALTHDARNRSPFFTETIDTASHTIYATINELSAAGNYYNIQLQVPQSATHALRRALQTVTLPPVATVTQAVHLIEHQTATGAGKLWIAKAAVAKTRWILLGGAVSTAQQPFYLFRTKDGTRWSLINYTSTPPHVFLNATGSPNMLFWSLNDGIIAEVTGWSHDVWIYNTQNGGQRWSLQKIALPSQPNAQKSLQIVGPKNGTLTITVTLQSGAKCQVATHDSGRTWTI